MNIDCADAEVMAVFYCRLLGWQVASRDHDFVLLENPTGGATLSFQQEAWYQPPVWPERPGELTKMIHLDLKVDDLAGAVAHVIAIGGRLADHQPRPDLRVMLDPAGHPFCLYTD
ncbi:MAG TPA: VOC family protein [Dehalococcoidia bacterium]|nr:VOC family protein [Dehalococcoidia bacterium]